LLPKQRIKTIEHEVLKQDSKMNLLSDKVMDMKMEFTLSGNQYRRPARQNRSNKYENEKKQADYIDISSSPMFYCFNPLFWQQCLYIFILFIVMRPI
jgi:hypothetical protein